MAELNGIELDVYEQQDSFGGVWNYSDDPGRPIDVPQTNPDQSLDESIWHTSFSNVDGNGESCPTFISPMYESLETNIPHCLMKYSDAPSLEDHQLFPSRQAVTEYLEDYGKDVRHLVKFQTQVVDVKQKGEGLQAGWSVQTRNLTTPHKILESEYDAVVVANGHYSVPSLPDIKGIREWDEANRGVISHSKTYRRPEPFTNKRVIIVGNSASGLDIASQIAKVAQKPLLNSTRSGQVFTSEASYCESVPEIIEFLPEKSGRRAVRFLNGLVKTDIDAILFCTGYYYSFPFLSSLSPKLISNGDRVQHLYKHVWYIPNPTLVFVGLPYRIIPFRTVEGQVAVIARVWSQRLDLPSKTEMRRWEESRVLECGSGKLFHFLPIPADFDYHNEMVTWASQARGETTGRLPPTWTEKDTWMRKRFPAMKKAFAKRGEQRHGVRRVEELGFDYDLWLEESN